MLTPVCSRSGCLAKLVLPLAGEPMSHEVLPAKPPPSRRPCTFREGEAP